MTAKLFNDASPAVLWCAAAMPHALFSAAPELAGAARRTPPSSAASDARRQFALFGPCGSRPAVCTSAGRVAAANAEALARGAVIGEEAAAALSRLPQLRVFYTRPWALRELAAFAAAAAMPLSSVRLLEKDLDGDGLSLAFLLEEATGKPFEERLAAAHSRAEALCRTLAALGFSAAAGVGPSPEFAAAAARAAWLEGEKTARAVLDEKALSALPLEALPLSSAEAAERRREGLTLAGGAIARILAEEADEASDEALDEAAAGASVEAGHDGEAAAAGPRVRIAALLGRADARRPLLKTPAALRLSASIEDDGREALETAAARLGLAAGRFAAAQGAEALRWEAALADGHGGISDEIAPTVSAASDMEAALRSALLHAEPEGVVRHITLVASPRRADAPPAVHPAWTQPQPDARFAAAAPSFAVSDALAEPVATEAPAAYGSGFGSASESAFEASLEAEMGPARVFRLSAGGRREALSSPAPSLRPPLRSPRGFGRGLRPTQRLADPVLLREERGMPCCRGPLLFLSDFEYVHAEDGSEREYIAAKSPAGDILWIFREMKSGRWFLEGRFA